MATPTIDGEHAVHVGVFCIVRPKVYNTLSILTFLGVSSSKDVKIFYSIPVWYTYVVWTNN